MSPRHPAGARRASAAPDPLRRLRNRADTLRKELCAADAAVRHRAAAHFVGLPTLPGVTTAPQVLEQTDRIRRKHALDAAVRELGIPGVTSWQEAHPRRAVGSDGAPWTLRRDIVYRCRSCGCLKFALQESLDETRARLGRPDGALVGVDPTTMRDEDLPRTWDWCPACTWGLTVPGEVAVPGGRQDA